MTPPEVEAGSDANEALMQFLYRAPVGLLQTTLDGTVEMMNPMGAQLLMPITATGDLDNLFMALGPRVPNLRATIDAFTARSGVVCDALRIEIEERRIGSPQVLSLSIMKLDAKRLMMVVDDATADIERENTASARSLREAARIDPVTRIPNRVAMVEHIQAVIHSGSATSAVLLIGCDRLKEIGDSFGNAVREQMLAAIVRRMNAMLRARDCVGCADDVDELAARVSGDEFVVLLQRLQYPDEAMRVARRIADALGKPYAIAGQHLQCPITVGIVDPAAGVSAEDVLRDASIALAEAKRRQGGRCVVFEPDMRERAIRRGGIESALRVALTDEQLFVVYQPVVDLQAGDGVRGVEGVEALVRWRHPERGIVPPAEFIGVAEETDLIGALGRFVLETACRQFVAWRRDLGIDAPRVMAVNLSRAQLADASIAATVAAVLSSTGMPPEALQLEVTESLAAQDDGVQASLAALKALGITIALDDFGTGYSSLSSLHLLPVDTVKIDRSFVTLLEGSAHHRVLVEATIRVARSLGMTTVAEGIETSGQADIIRTLGADKGQGYLYSKPLMADDIPAWIRTRSSHAILKAA